jgi:hypothetical protein
MNINVAVTVDIATERVLANASWEELGAASKQAFAVRFNDWKVVNAPRPILGEVRWAGAFGHGTFYAAGPAEQYARTWESDDAWEVVRMTNFDITEKLVGILLEAGTSLATVVDEGTPVAKVARWYNLPWRTA